MAEERVELIKGFEDYLISDFGRVYSFKNEGEIKELRPGEAGGYFFVILCKNGIKKKFKIHRLVGIYFIPNPNNLPTINHIDMNKQNNHFTNLEWCSHSEQHIKKNRHFLNHTIPHKDKKSDLPVNIRKSSSGKFYSRVYDVFLGKLISTPSRDTLEEALHDRDLLKSSIIKKHEEHLEQKLMSIFIKEEFNNFFKKMDKKIDLMF